MPRKTTRPALLASDPDAQDGPLMEMSAAVVGGAVVAGAAEVALSEMGGTGDLPLRLRIHDSSRFEWTLVIPLPSGRKIPYELLVQLEVPAGAAGSQSPWDQLQILSRLDGPTGIASTDDVTVDVLRRGAVTLAQMLARARDGFARHCTALFGEPSGNGTAATGFDGGEKEFLLIWLEAALCAVHETREKLVTVEPEEPPQIARERELVDEFASIRLLEMLAESRRAISLAAAGGAERELADRVHGRIAEALRDEFGYRERKNFLRADRRSAADLDAYLTRAAKLKKHFEEVLFLDRETEQLDERVQQWTSTVGALFGGIVAFVAIQVALTHRRPGPLEVGWGLAALAMIAGLGYAARNRMREWGRCWLAEKVHSFHAQRVARCRVPSRRLATRDVIVEAREWCHEATTSGPDPLNPEAGASLRTTHVRYLHKGVVHPQEELSDAGVQSVRHIFRYDLSPLFPRLEDDLKLVPVLDECGRISVVEAVRKYRVRVSVCATFAGEHHEHKAELVLDKDGLHDIALDPRKTERIATPSGTHKIPSA